MNGDAAAWTALPVPPSLLGESPFWHPDEAALYWCDIPGRALHRFAPGSGEHRHWSFDSEPACCAPRPDGTLLVAQRDGLFVFDPAHERRRRLAAPPYDEAQTRFNDGKADAQGRFWVSTIFEPRTAPRAALYRYAAGRLDRLAGDATVGNGVAFSPDARTLYWADTTSHRIDAFDFDIAAGALSNRRVFVQFTPKPANGDLGGYGGRPDGAAIDAEGALWVAMFEGQRLVRLAPDGRLLDELPLPVRCPTMPCFGGADLKTLYVTTSREKRPADELAAQPLAGAVLTARVAVPGLPVHFARA
ncbi:MAG: SMP-30/gluconolactonase/LRE family protein [Rubrivivax sp.]|nr:SMP-30/gluconolactonase/LRE family protein [Rubrivivax sp.]MCL4696143.1 SMP-30/gluconolactonase/LRE family protein [Burkholderiaceae bacterium]